MQAQQSGWAVPSWWHRYQAQEGSFSTIDNGTLAFLSTNFGGLPVLLLPVDYTLPAPPPAVAAARLAVPSASLPESRARQVPDVPSATVEELERLLSGAAAAGGSEAELVELSAWFSGLPSSAKQETLASVSRSLSAAFGAPGEPALLQQPQPPQQQVRAPAATLNVYCDAPSALAAPAAKPAPAAAAARAAMADVTNLHGGAAAGGRSLKQLSSKLHVAHSQKAKPQLPAQDVQALLDYQLRSAEPSRAPWFRGGQQGAATCNELHPLAVQETSLSAGTGVFVPQAAPPRR